jgi:hypothetical protein
MRLSRHEMRQLAQRLTMRCELSPFAAADVGPYISHRLSVAGNGSTVRFSDAATRLVYAVSGGIPRVINLLCDGALAHAARADRMSVEAEDILESSSGLKLHVPLNVRTMLPGPPRHKPQEVLATQETRPLDDGNGATGHLESVPSKPEVPSASKGPQPEPQLVSTNLSPVNEDVATEVSSQTDLSPSTEPQMVEWDERPELDLGLLDQDWGPTSPRVEVSPVQPESSGEGSRRVAIPITRKRGSTIDIGEESLPVRRTLPGKNMRAAGGLSLNLNEAYFDESAAPPQRRRTVVKKRRWPAAIAFVLTMALAGYWYWMSAGGQKVPEVLVGKLPQALVDLVAPNGPTQPAASAAPAEALPTTSEPASGAAGPAGSGQTEARFALRAATFESGGAARRAIEELQAAGYRAYSTNVTRQDGTTAVTVFLGPYAERTQAERDFGRVRKISGYETASIVPLGPPDFRPGLAPNVIPD